MYNCVNLQVCYNNYVNLYWNYFFFTYLENKGRELTTIVACKEIKTIKK